MENLPIIAGEVGYDIMLSDFTSSSKFILNSYGGEVNEGFAIHDYLRGQTDSEVGVIGVCASIATVILLGAKSRWASPNSMFLIHNPWSITAGDASELVKTADELKALQDRLVALYVRFLNIPEAEIVDLMVNETRMDAEKALGIGLIHEIRTDWSGVENGSEVLEGETAKAMFYNLKRIKMTTVSKNELKDELKAFEESFFTKVKNLFKPIRAVALLVKDVNGQEIDFDVETEDQIAVGTKATVNGDPAKGEYVLADGRTLVFESGIVTEIKEPSTVPGTTVEELQSEIVSLEAQLAEQKTANALLRSDYEKEVNILAADFAKFKNTFSGKIDHINMPEKKDENVSRSAFKKQ
jgi:ATP-dependent protease ClpP protease subunit